MPVYTFRLRDGHGDVEDTTGVQFSDRDSALGYARDVVDELMRSREAETRPWCLDVYEGDEADSPIGEIPFASVDPSLDHLTPKYRAMVESVSERKRLLSDVIHTVKGTLMESQALVARARGKPYLAVLKCLGSWTCPTGSPECQNGAKIQSEGGVAANRKYSLAEWNILPA